MSNESDYWSSQSRVSYYWLENQLDDDDTFRREALDILRHVDPGSTHSTASSAIQLMNHWLVERELTVYDRGKPVADVVAIVLYPDENGKYARALDSVEQGWRIDRAELVRLLTRNMMTVPNFLVPAVPLAEREKSGDGDDSSTLTWTEEKRQELREEHAALRAERHHSPTMALAEKYQVSPQRIRELKAETKAKPGHWSGLDGT